VLLQGLQVFIKITLTHLNVRSQKRGCIETLVHIATKNLAHPLEIVLRELVFLFCHKQPVQLCKVEEAILVDIAELEYPVTFGLVVVGLHW